MCWILILTLGIWPVAADVPWTTGAKFDWALDQPVVATWQNAELRIAARSLSEQRRVPLVFDRRLNPNQVFSLETTGIPLRESWGRLAAVSQGSVSITSNAVYLGPVAAAGKLRTLIALRQADLQQVATKLPTSKRKSLTARLPLSWRDLDSPTEILQRIADERNLQIQHGERVPHDLWGATDLPALSLEEALTLILIQYDLTFRLDAAGTSLELIPIPEKLAIEKKWTLPRSKVDTISRAIEDTLPEVVTTSTAEQLVAQGTQEQLEQLELLIRSVTSGAPVKKKPKAVTPLSKRSLTFQAKDAPLSAILEKLAGTGIEFEFDRAKLKQQGIDIDQLVAIDVKEVPPEKLFEALFHPVKIHFEIDGLRVVLSAEENQK